jgi:putative effector of murein hydrolase
MTLHVAQACTALVHSPLFGITLTLGAYQAARTLARKTHRSSLTNPVPVAIVLVAAVLLISHVSYADYLNGGQYIGVLLGPATVALALPVHRRRSTETHSLHR